ncbi:MAG: CDP-alcohol phosphatidyltransferase family protein [Methylotenera sp.]|nr:CDP-alcohol phosphatidyltransferase family protein [Oligoflexia bacterium]
MAYFDRAYTLLLMVLAGVVAAAYAVRVKLKGRVRYDRVDRQGGSALLSKGLMEMAYWSMQPVARLLVFFHVTPNRISWASLVFGLLAGACLAYGHFGFGAGFAAVSGFLDSLDGMVARLTGVSSDAGEILDATVDRYVEFFFVGGLVIYYREIPVLQILALLALIGSFMVSYSTAKAEALHIDPPKGSMRRPERAVYLTLGAALSPITIQMFETYRDFAVPVGHPMVMALGLVAVVANVSAVERLWAVAKIIRIREQDAAEAKRLEAIAALTASERTGHTPQVAPADHPANGR